MSAEKPLTFIAHNRDGLGERLRAVGNAMILAEHFDAQFKFYWPDLRENLRDVHSVLPAEEFFDPQFIADYMISDEEFEAMGEVPMVRDAPLDEIKAKLSEEGAVLSVQQPHLSHQVKGIEAELDIDGLFPKTFARMRFVEDFEKARRAAEAVEFPKNPTAIHLRSGDIIYGMYRTMDAFHGKVVSYPIALELAKQLAAKGETPVIFGQDADLTQYMKEATGGLRVDDLAAPFEFTQTQNAVFDICMFGRCNRIFAGQSGFAILGAWLAGRKIENPARFLTPEESITCIEKTIFEGDDSPLVSDMQKAFACRAAFVIGKRTIAEDDQWWRLLQAGRSYDPTNDFTQLVYAASLANAGDVTEVNSVLFTLLNRPPKERGRIMAVLKNYNAHTGLVAEPYLPYLAKAAEGGSAMAALCMAVSSRALDHGDDLAKFSAMYEAGANEEEARIGKRMLA